MNEIETELLSKHISQISFELRKNPTKAKEILGAIDIEKILPICLGQETQPERLLINMLTKLDLELLRDVFDIVIQIKEMKE